MNIMCKSPIKIVNRNKYLTKDHGQQYYIWVNCGHCSECRREKENEWILRTYYNNLKCIEQGGFIYFDTLTYSNEHLPRLNTKLTEIDDIKNYPCFDYRDIRQFLEKLRYLYRNTNTKIEHFITSEYGSIRNRPHYHIIMYVYNCNEALKFSENVARAWNRGRTDGIVYKSKLYVTEHNIITKLNLNCIRYVAKYVTKSQHFMDIINKRWTKIETYLKDKKHYNKVQIKRIKKKYYRYTQPFHRQSQHYGENALDYMTPTDIIDNNRMYFRNDNINLIKYISLPMYFKRKLWQEQIKYNGKRMWITTEEGAEVMKEREKIILHKLENRLRDTAKTLGKEYSDEQIQELAHYILLERGRTQGEFDYLSHHQEAIAYNYNTIKDAQAIKKNVISKRFAGNDKIGYCVTDIEEVEKEEWEKLVYNRSDLEAIIEDLQVNEDNHALVLKKEHMSEIRKIFFRK